MILYLIFFSSVCCFRFLPRDSSNHDDDVLSREEKEYLSDSFPIPNKTVVHHENKDPLPYSLLAQTAQLQLQLRIHTS